MADNLDRLENSVPALEAVKSGVNERDKGVIADSAQVQRIRQLLANYPPSKTRVFRDEANALTTIAGNEEIVVHLVQLEHH